MWVGVGAVQRTPSLTFPSSSWSVFILALPEVDSAMVQHDLTLATPRNGQQAGWRSF